MSVGRIALVPHGEAWPGIVRKYGAPVKPSTFKANVYESIDGGEFQFVGEFECYNMAGPIQGPTYVLIDANNYVVVAPVD